MRQREAGVLRHASSVCMHGCEMKLVHVAVVYVSMTHPDTVVVGVVG